MEFKMELQELSFQTNQPFRIQPQFVEILYHEKYSSLFIHYPALLALISEW